MSPLPRSALIVCLLLMLAAVAVVLLVGGGGEGLPQGPIVETDSAVDSGNLSADLAMREEASRVGMESAERTAVIGSGDLDPDIQKALSGFRGRIVDFSEQPVADCGVRIYRFAMDSVIRPGVSPMGEGMEPEFVAGETQTGDDGRFLITGVWPQGIYSLLGGIGTDNPLNRIIQQSPAPGEIVDLGDIQLNNGAVLIGTVVDSDDRPIPGALVRAVDLPGQIVGVVPVERFDPAGAVLIREPQSPIQVVSMPAWVEKAFEHLPIPTTRSAPDGSFRLVGLAPAPNLFAVTSPGYLSEVKPRIVLKPGEVRDMGRIRLREGESVYGQVVDGKGGPVVGAEVVAAPTTGVAPIDFGSFVGPTDEEGRFEAEGFPRGRVTAAARQGPGHAWVLAEPQSIDQDIIITLPAAYSLTVSVLKADGEAADAPELRLIPASGDDGIGEMATLGLIPPVPLQDRLSRLEDGRHRIDNLSEGGYTLLATSPGHALSSAQVELLGEDADVAVSLAAEVTYKVMVVDPLGEPVRRASIYAQERGRPRFSEVPLHVGYTRADGKLSFTDISSERVRLSATHPAYGMAHAEGALADGEILITMIDPGSIHGILTEKGAAPTPGKWTVFAMGRGSSRGALEMVPSLATPGLEGRFKFPHLQPDQYQVQVVNSLNMLSSPGAMFAYGMEVGMGSDVGTSVEVVSGQISTVELDISPDIVEGPSARITGMVLVDGQPGKDLRVMVSGDDLRKNAVVDEAGRFDLSYVPEGEVRLTVIDTSRTEMFDGPMSSFWSETVTVVANQDQDKIFEIETSSLSGMVFTPGGFASTMAMVRIEGRTEGEDRGNRIAFTSSTDAQGRFKFTRIPAAMYAVEAFSIDERTARGSRSGVEVLAGLPTLDVQVTLIPTVVVSGTVDFSNFGEPKPRWVFVQFELEGGDGREGTSGGTMIGEDGSFEVENLLPGAYRIRARTNVGQPYEHPTLIQLGNADVTGLVIRPVRKDGR